MSTYKEEKFKSVNIIKFMVCTLILTKTTEIIVLFIHIGIIYVCIDIYVLDVNICIDVKSSRTYRSTPLISLPSPLVVFSSISTELKHGKRGDVLELKNW